MKLGTETGSLVNHVLSNQDHQHDGIEPGVTGATILMWSDRRAATIVKVTKCQIHVQEDRAERVDKNGMSESQEYVYTRDETARVRVFRKTKRGWRDSSGAGLMVGIRKAYHDFSF